MSERGPTVAIAHDYLTQRGGAERVVLAMLEAFPDAILYTALYDPDGTYPEFRAHRIVTSPVDLFGFLRRNHRYAYPFLAPSVILKQIPADVLIVSSSGWAHGFRTTGRSLVYCHSPARWLYQPEHYLGGPAWASPQGIMLLATSPLLRRWDRWSARRADRYLANSRAVRDRIQEAYGIEADILPAPHGVAGGADRAQDPVPTLADWQEVGYHLVVSRLLPYKNVDAAVDAFRDTEERLVIVGRGPDEAELRHRLPANARLVEDLTDPQMRWVYSHAHAIVAPSYEDYGLTPLEGATFGKPTLALRAGGYLDTVVDGTTGLHFDEPTAAAIRAAVVESRERSWDTQAIMAHAAAFSEETFIERLRAEVARLV
jgi:glycosyltransferase involved in cell wall biosynthesis